MHFQRNNMESISPVLSCSLEVLVTIVTSCPVLSLYLKHVNSLYILSR